MLEEQYYLATQWQLMWRKFRRHRLALAGGAVLVVFYVTALLAEFVAPTVPAARDRELVSAPPHRVRLVHDGALRGPFIYGYDREIEMLTTQRIYTPNRELVHPIRLFVRGEAYRFWGLFETDLHLFGAVSWGTLLQDAQNVQTVILYPWLMLPELSVVATMLMFNFLGDGLRDAADPYKAV